MIKRFLFLMVPVLLAFGIPSEPGRDIVQVNKRLSLAQTYRVRTHVVFNYTHQSKVEIKASSKKLGTLFSYSTPDYAYLANKRMQLAVNHEAKTIFVLDPRDEDDVKPDANAIEKALDTLVNKEVVYSLESDNGNYRKIKASIKEPAPYTGIYVVYHAKDFYLKEIEYVSGKDLRESGLKSLRVVYDEFNFNPGLSEKDFWEGEYIKMSGRKIKGPADKYKGYKIIDQRFER